ncbi:hypothetical protein NLI96_g2423 [Meripilus lineatus]|uniref:Uncharacterized protein n=1 Tax=Meripilus lineatus TaxID=2056292 RepID=A0AAD5V8N9_9APHY|nr:hypothetical protein NLI96_g2423 [Physisporinus lineatus]
MKGTIESSFRGLSITTDNSKPSVSVHHQREVPVSSLPPELLDIVYKLLWQTFAQAVSDIVFSPFLHGYPLTESSASRQSATATINLARRPLVQVAAVSRGWYNSSIHFLYSHVVLLSYRQLWDFHRTVKESQFVASLVKELSFFVPHGRPHSSTLNRQFQFHHQAADILLQCTLVQSIHICSPDSEPPARHTLHNRVPSAPQSTRIVSFTAHSLAFMVVPTTFEEYPHLEALTFNRCLIPRGISLLTVSSLHTLKFRETYSIEPSFLSRSNLPSLRHLWLYRSALTLPPDTSVDDRTFDPPVLETLHLVENVDEPDMTFEILHQSGALSRLRTLCSTLNPYLSVWEFPESLQSLMIFIPRDAGPFDTYPILEALRLNATSIQQSSCALSQITINLHCLDASTEALSTHESESLEGIRVNCDKIRLAVDFNVIDLDHWVMHYGDLISMCPRTTIDETLDDE